MSRKRMPITIRIWLPATCAIGVTLGACGVTAESWTNQAGHIIHATVIACRDGTVSFRTDRGVELQVPVSALCETDRRRLLRWQGKSAAPEFACEAYRDASAMLRRYDLMTAGRRPEKRAEIVASALSLFDSRIAAHLAGSEIDADASNEITRLRAALTAVSAQKESSPGNAQTGFR